MPSESDEDGFYYGWIVVVACFIGTFVVFGLSYSFGVFFERILAEFGHSRGVTSIAFGLQTFTLYIGAVLVGALVDRYGTRQILLAGTGLLCVGLLGTSQAESLLALFLFYGVITGFGMCAVYVVSYATVPRWFDRHVGLAGGIASAGLGAGMLFVAPASTALIEETGWRTAFVLLAAGATALLLVAAVLIRDDPLTADVTPPEDEFVGEPTPATDESLREQLEAVRRIAFTPSFFCLFVGWVAIYTTLYVVFSHIVVHVTDLGISAAVGAMVIAIIGGASAVARVGIGHIADAVGRTAVFGICSAVMGLATVALPFATSSWALLAFAFVYGIGYGGNGALLSPLTADLFGRENINAVFGLISGSFAISGLIAPYIAGLGYDSIGTYNPVFIAAGIAAVGGAGLIVLADRLAQSRTLETAYDSPPG
ncbi:Predicted arabinose efflux permease, MFS family [Natronorubrum sediminis]|uniref:Predicted arabinose efflux permease, MFS family n=1 Tax=Natronorubrum sediminis TaxID=640943 RepID=A0A1H6G555_9EURY|nr:MFS transporter [Natronorubrum sediminis]SEH17463.1 Predicted arabinose efflux permease, MFS family [Natronorubrum sediminis]